MTDGNHAELTARWRPLDSQRVEILLAAALAAATGILLILLGPAPQDEPAHLYRTLLARDHALVWDNLWYGGHYPLAYSLLYYPLAAAVGNLPLVLASAIACAYLFSSICFDEWGEAARWPSRAFGILAAAPLFTGLYSYSLGLAALLGSVRAFQLRRSWLGVALAALTLGFSPLAFGFLCIVLVAVLVAQRRISRRTILIALAVAATAGVGGIVLVLFPSGGVYPFSPWDLMCVLIVSGLGAALAWRAPRGHAIAAVFVLWGLTCVISYLVPSPIGDNITRLRALVFPVMLLTALLCRFRPRLLSLLAVSCALAYNLVPYLMQIPYRSDGRPAQEAFWAPALGYLQAHRDPGFRVEVVPTVSHWEAWWIPSENLALARGWYRQLDEVENPVLYGKHLTAAAYRMWLRSVGVRYVLRPVTRLDPVGAVPEAALLDSGRSGLVPVFRSRDTVVYELPAATPILTGPGAPRVTSLGHDRIAGVVTAAGVYRLRVRYTRYWRVAAGDVCLRALEDGMTAVDARSPGPFAIRVDGSPEALIDSITGAGTGSC